MGNRECCAAKDYLRDYYDILDAMIYGMTRATQTDSISHNFIAQMIPHERAAIEMSQRLLDCSDYLPLRDVANTIIYDGKRSIAEMEKLRKSSLKEHSGAKALRVYDGNYRRITEVMFKEMRIADVTERINCDFINEMLPHHMGGIKMAENAIGVGVSTCLVPILNDIIDSLKRQIENMQKIRCAFECT